MRAFIASAGFLFIGLAIAFVLKPQRDFPVFLRVFAIWGAATAVGFLVPDRLAALGILFVALALIAPTNPVERVGCFIATFPALPEYFSAEVPFPGLNYLLVADYAKVAILAILGPVFLRAVMRPAPKQLRLVDHLVFAFFILTGVLTIRALPFTSMLRAIFDQALILLIPYIAISRTLTTAEDFRKILQYLYVGAIILAGVGLVCWVKQWNIYFMFLSGDSVRGTLIVRDSILRIEGPMLNVMFGYVMAFGALLTAHYLGRKQQSPLLAAARGAVFLFVCYIALSRGAILAGLVSAAVLFAMTRLGSGARNGMFALGGLGALIGALNIFSNGFGAIDPYGTFNYRVELMRAGLSQLAAHPLFGTPRYVESGRFDHLMQGQGIIDVVNSYLQIALANGLVGLAVFLLANGLVIGACVAAAGRIPRRGSAEDREAASANGLLAAGLIGVLTLMATTSLISYVPHYATIFLALAKSNAVRLASAYPKRRAAPDVVAGDLYAPGEGRAADA